jgi:predicted Rossmann fold nucleotide-binding protein DprA/Smf involved in DNA uptake
MRVGVIGSRKFQPSASVKSFIGTLSQPSVIVSGGCAGPDLWAEEAARAVGLEVMIFLPTLPPKGSPRHQFTDAFYARNRLIAENSDILHAFVSPDRKGGTEYTIKHAEKIGIPVVIHTS